MAAPRCQSCQCAPCQRLKDCPPATCQTCGEPRGNWRHVESIVFDGRPAHQFAPNEARRKGAVS